MSKVAPLVEAYTAQQMLDLRQSLRSWFGDQGWIWTCANLSASIDRLHLGPSTGRGGLSSVLHQFRVSDAAMCETTSPYGRVRLTMLHSRSFV